MAVAVKLIGRFGGDLRAGGPGGFAMGVHVVHVNVQADGGLAVEIGGAAAVFLAGGAHENEAVRAGIFAAGLEAKRVFQKRQSRGGVVVVHAGGDARHVGGRILDGVAHFSSLILMLRKWRLFGSP